MNTIHRLSKFLLLCLIVLPMISCASGKGKRSHASIPSDSPAIEAISRATYEETLREVARKDITRSMNTRPGSRSRVIVQKPYFYKRYTEYPDGPDAFEIEIKESDSRATPMLGDVRANMYRYATKLHKNKDAAREDYRFLRNTGVERISYQFMNGQWRRVGSLYMAEATHEQISGEWQVLRELPTENLVGEQSQKTKGRFGRMWDRVRFWK